MRLLLDENVPINLKKILSRAGFDVGHVLYEKKCKGKSDIEILEYALKNKMSIVSFDSDFCSLRKREHYGIIKVDSRLKNKEEALLELLKMYKTEDMKEKYFPIDREKAFLEIKKYARKRHFFKQYQKIPIPLKCLQKA